MTQHADDVSAFDPTFTATAVGQRCGVCLPKAHVAPVAARQHV